MLLVPPPHDPGTRVRTLEYRYAIPVWPYQVSVPGLEYTVYLCRYMFEKKRKNVPHYTLASRYLPIK